MSDNSPHDAASSDGAQTVPVLGFPRDRLVYWAVALALLGILAYVGWRYVGTVVLGLFVYYVTRPVFQRIYYRVESRTLAVVASLLLVALPVLVLVTWTLVIAFQVLSDSLTADLVGQFETLVGPYVDLADVFEELSTTVRDAVRDPSRLSELRLGEVGGTALSVLQASVVTLFNALLHLFIVVVIAFYLLRDGHRLARWAGGTFAPSGSVTERYFLAVDRDLKNVYFGNILNALVTSLLGVVTYLALNVVAPPGVRIPEPALLGLLVGAASLVPVVGMKIVWVPVALYLFGVSLLTAPETAWFPVAFALVSIVIVDYIPDQLLRPYVSGRSLHVGAVMLAYILGPLLFGWYGIFLGPLILVLVFEFARVVVPWLLDGEAPPVDPDLEWPEPRPTDAAAADPEAAVSDQPADAGEDRPDAGGAEDSPSGE